MSTLRGLQLMAVCDATLAWMIIRADQMIKSLSDGSMRHSDLSGDDAIELHAEIAISIRKLSVKQRLLLMMIARIKESLTEDELITSKEAIRRFGINDNCALDVRKEELRRMIAGPYEKFAIEVFNDMIPFCEAKYRSFFWELIEQVESESSGELDFAACDAWLKKEK